MGLDRVFEDKKVIATLSGVVVQGKSLGRTVRMPTANLEVESGVVPPSGVYATISTIDGVSHFGVTNVGMRPSVDNEMRTTVETFILDFDGDIYGERQTLEFYVKLRETKKFDSLDEVARQVQNDIQKVREIFS